MIRWEGESDESINEKCGMCKWSGVEWMNGCKDNIGGGLVIMRGQTNKRLWKVHMNKIEGLHRGGDVKTTMLFVKEILKEETRYVRRNLSNTGYKFT